MHGDKEGRVPIERNFYTVQEAADALEVTTNTIRRAIFDGTLRAEKIGPRLSAIAPEEIERYRTEHLGKQGWDKRREPGHEPSAQAVYMRKYRARLRMEQSEGRSATEEEEGDGGRDPG